MTSPYVTFSPHACELLQHHTLPQWLSFFREVGFCENRRNLERNLRDKKARLRQSAVRLVEGSLDWMAFEARNLCRNAAGCYQVTCQECMFGFLREFLIAKEMPQFNNTMNLGVGISRIPSQSADSSGVYYEQLSRRSIAEAQIRCIKQHHVSCFEGIFGSFLPCMMVGLVLNESLEHGYDELQKAYLAWRKSRYAFKVNPGDELASEIRHVSNVPGAMYALSMLNMWGDILNDHALFIQGHYTERDLYELYGLNPVVIEYLFSHRFDWDKEIESAEAFAGLMSSLLSPESIQMLRDILGHINTQGLVLIIAELELAGRLDPTAQMGLQSVVGRFRQPFDLFRDILCMRYLEDVRALVPS